jgi:hypothetical protein
MRPDKRYQKANRNLVGAVMDWVDHLTETDVLLLPPRLQVIRNAALEARDAALEQVAAIMGTRESR